MRFYAVFAVKATEAAQWGGTSWSEAPVRAAAACMPLYAVAPITTSLGRECLQLS
jgi:hypothetical protein